LSVKAGGPTRAARNRYDVAMPKPASKPRGWLAAFCVATVVFVGGLVFLGISVSDAIGGDGHRSAPPVSSGGTLPAGASATTSASATSAGKDRVLSVDGAVPRAVAGYSFQPVAAGGTADLTVSAVRSGGGAWRTWVPVASLRSGLESVTRAQLDGLLAGTTTFAAAGGVGGAPVFAAVADAPPFDLPGAPGKSFASYADLRAAMADMDTDAPLLIAFVPLEELGAEMTPLIVDSVDVVTAAAPDSWPFFERVDIRANTKKGSGAQPQIVAALKPAAPAVTRIVATGDILQSRCSLTQIEATGDWAAALRGATADYLAGADLTLGSLDGSIQDLGRPFGCVDTTNLTSPPEVIAALTLAGFDEMTIATNHIADCGQDYCGTGMKAMLRTMELLAAANIKTVGGGKNLTEATAPAIFEVNGVRIGVLGYDDIAAEDLEATDDEPGTAPLDDSYADEKADPPAEPAFYKSPDLLHLTHMEQNIRDLKQQVDVVVVQIQSGTEDTHDPSPRSLKALRAAKEAGADLVVGNQAHWVQAIEARDGVFVAYALGNFIFDQVHTPEHTEGYVLEAILHGKKLVAVRMKPYVIQSQYRPVFVDGARRAKILGDVFDASETLPAWP
jgi:poly-gamma-glutamate capsule biosynthesis protein CapA/YwtB (metallophosphatase superfamily)